MTHHLARTEVHEIHTSERKSFRACRRRWHWLFMENYYPTMTAKPLDYGVAYHVAMEKFYDPATYDWDPLVRAELAITAFVNKTNEQRAKFIKANDGNLPANEIQEDFDERVELGKGMIRYHLARIAPREDTKWKPVRVEVAFQVPILHPETSEPLTCSNPACRHPAGAPVVYAGRFDALGIDIHGDYWIIDWKTCRVLLKDEDFLYLDDQISSYVWACRILGLNVRGFIYHEMKKGYPKPPNKNKQQRLGCWFSKNKQQDLSLDLYLETIKEHDLEAYEEVRYDDILEYLKEEEIRYYQRFQIHKSDYELEQIGLNIGYEALDMIDPGLRVYPSPGRFSCQTCAFRQPCLGQNQGEDYMYTLKTLFEQKEHYYVREEASTESKGGE
jgi:hypothetical protein